MATIDNILQHNIPLAPCTTFKIGGPSRFFIEPVNMTQFRESIDWALQSGVQYFVLGGGANILIHDNGYEGLIIHTGKLNKITVRQTTIEAECGAVVDTLVEMSAQHLLSGIEFAAGLPGTVGGALFMNAKAYESDFSNIVQSVQALKVENKTVTESMLKKADLEFSYKKSIFQEKEWYVYKVFLSLSQGKHPDIKKRIENNRKKRRRAGQFTYPNAGCIFKNDYRTLKPTGRIIEELGLKGKKIGDAEVYQEHGNFIINRGNATADDVCQLIEFVEQTVLKETGIRLQREIILLGDWS